MNRFGGHAGAAGFEFHADHLSSLVQSLQKFYDESAAQEKTVIVDYDLDVTMADLTPAQMRWLESLGPYGQGFASPLLRLREVRVRDFKVLKGGHLKLWFEPAILGQKPLEALYFSPPPTITAAQFSKGITTLDVLGELQWNDFAGQRNLQLNVKELKFISPARATDFTSEANL